jgi:hypothetical protein
MNLGARNIEYAKEMACAFNKLFLLTVKCWHKHWFQSGYGSGDGASVIVVEQVAREFKSSSSAICATDSLQHFPVHFWT